MAAKDVREYHRVRGAAIERGIIPPRVMPKKKELYLAVREWGEENPGEVLPDGIAKIVGYVPAVSEGEGLAEQPEPEGAAAAVDEISALREQVAGLMERLASLEGQECVEESRFESARKGLNDAGLALAEEHEKTRGMVDSLASRMDGVLEMLDRVDEFRRKVLSSIGTLDAWVPTLEARVEGLDNAVGKLASRNREAAAVSGEVLPEDIKLVEEPLASPPAAPRRRSFLDQILGIG